MFNVKIERREQLSAEEFVEAYLAPGRPVIVTDAMLAWSASSRLNPAYVERELGQFDVLVYDNLFDLQDICLLSRYLKEHFNKPDDECHLYVRAYSQLRSVDFAFWADSLLDRLKDDWRSPYFLPESDYVVPFYMGGCTFNPACHRAPYRGLFISGKVRGLDSIAIRSRAARCFANSMGRRASACGHLIRRRS